MISGITSNIDELKEALLIYQNVVKKEAVEAMYNKMGDLAFSAAENTYHTSPEKVRNEISNLPITKDNGRTRKGNTRFVGQYKLMNWERKRKGLPTLGGSKFRKVTSYKLRPGQIFAEEKTTKKRNMVRAGGPMMRASAFMDGKYKKFIQMRGFSAKYLRVGWAVAAAAFGKPFRRGDFGPATLARLSNGKIAGGETKKLNADVTEFMIYNGTGQTDARNRKPYPQRSASDMRRAYDIIKDGLEKGINKVLYDPVRGIIPYLEKRYDRTQRAISVLKKMKAI